MKVVLKVAYDGGGFAGFQRQPDVKTVQGTLESALRQILNHPVALDGAGRTDRGVHSTGQVVAFSTPGSSLNLRKLCRSINALSREPLAVLEGVILDDDDPFHPRFSANARTYFYYIMDGCGPQESLFWNPRAWCLPEVVDWEKAQEIANVFLGSQDFSTFSFQQQDKHTCVREIFDLQITREPVATLLSPNPGPRLIRLSITANGFLRRMVRLLTAAVVEAGVGRRSLEDVRSRLGARKPSLAPHPAPPQGLYLSEIHYDPDPFLVHSETPRHYSVPERTQLKFKG